MLQTLEAQLHLTPETKFLVNDLRGSPEVPAPQIIHPGMTSFVETDSVEFWEQAESWDEAWGEWVLQYNLPGEKHIM